MQLKLSSQLGLNFLDAHTQLSNEEHPEIPDWRETTRQEVAANIEATEKAVAARTFQIDTLQIFDASIHTLYFLSTVKFSYI